MSNLHRSNTFQIGASRAQTRQSRTNAMQVQRAKSTMSTSNFMKIEPRKTPKVETVKLRGYKEVKALEEIEYVEIGNLTVGLLEARSISLDNKLFKGTSVNAPLNTSLQVEYHGQSMQTKWVYGTKDPHYDESAVLGVYDPLFKAPVVISLLALVGNKIYTIGYVQIHLHDHGVRYGNSYNDYFKLHDPNDKLMDCEVRVSLNFVAQSSRINLGRDERFDVLPPSDVRSPGSPYTTSNRLFKQASSNPGLVLRELQKERRELYDEYKRLFYDDFKSYVSECGLNNLELQKIEKEYWSHGIDPFDERAYDGFLRRQQKTVFQDIMKRALKIDITRRPPLSPAERSVLLRHCDTDTALQNGMGIVRMAVRSADRLVAMDHITENLVLGIFGGERRRTTSDPFVQILYFPLGRQNPLSYDKNRWEWRYIEVATTNTEYKVIQPNFGENENVAKFKDQSKLKTEFRLGCFETGTRGRVNINRFFNNYQDQLTSYSWERISDENNDAEEKKDNGNAYRIVQRNEEHPDFSKRFHGRNGLDVHAGNIVGAYCEIPVKVKDKQGMSPGARIDRSNIEFIKWGGTKDGQGPCKRHIKIHLPRPRGIDDSFMDWSNHPGEFVFDVYDDDDHELSTLKRLQKNTDNDFLGRAVVRVADLVPHNEKKLEGKQLMLNQTLPLSLRGSDIEALPNSMSDKKKWLKSQDKKLLDQSPSRNFGHLVVQCQLEVRSVYHIEGMKNKTNNFWDILKPANKRGDDIQATLESYLEGKNYPPYVRNDQTVNPDRYWFAEIDGISGRARAVMNYLTGKIHATEHRLSRYQDRQLEIALKLMGLFRRMYVDVKHTKVLGYLELTLMEGFDLTRFKKEKQSGNDTKVLTETNTEVNAQVDVIINNLIVHQFSIKPQDKNPRWNELTRIPITNHTRRFVELRVYDHNKSNNATGVKRTCIGKVVIDLHDVFAGSWKLHKNAEPPKCMNTFQMPDAYLKGRKQEGFFKSSPSPEILKFKVRKVKTARVYKRMAKEHDDHRVSYVFPIPNKSKNDKEHIDVSIKDLETVIDESQDAEATEIWKNFDQALFKLYQHENNENNNKKKFYWLYEYKTRFQNKVTVPIPPLQAPSSNREEYNNEKYLPLCGEGNATMHYVDGWYNLHDGETSPGPGYLRVKAQLEGISLKSLHASGKEIDLFDLMNHEKKGFKKRFKKVHREKGYDESKFWAIEFAQEVSKEMNNRYNYLVKSENEMTDDVSEATKSLFSLYEDARVRQHTENQLYRFSIAISEVDQLLGVSHDKASRVWHERFVRIRTLGSDDRHDNTVATPTQVATLPIPVYVYENGKRIPISTLADRKLGRFAYKKLREKVNSTFRSLDKTCRSYKWNIVGDTIEALDEHSKLGGGENEMDNTIMRDLLEKSPWFNFGFFSPSMLVQFEVVDRTQKKHGVVGINIQEDDFWGPANQEVVVGSITLSVAEIYKHLCSHCKLEQLTLGEEIVEVDGVAIEDLADLRVGTTVKVDLRKAKVKTMEKQLVDGIVSKVRVNGDKVGYDVVVPQISVESPLELHCNLGQDLSGQSFTSMQLNRKNKRRAQGTIHFAIKLLPPRPKLLPPSAASVNHLLENQYEELVRSSMNVKERMKHVLEHHAKLGRRIKKIFANDLKVASGDRNNPVPAIVQIEVISARNFRPVDSVKKSTIFPYVQCIPSKSVRNVTGLHTKYGDDAVRDRTNFQTGSFRPESLAWDNPEIQFSDEIFTFEVSDARHSKINLRLRDYGYTFEERQELKRNEILQKEAREGHKEHKEDTFFGNVTVDVRDLLEMLDEEKLKRSEEESGTRMHNNNVERVIRRLDRALRRLDRVRGYKKAAEPESQLRSAKSKLQSAKSKLYKTIQSAKTEVTKAEDAYENANKALKDAENKAETCVKSAEKFLESAEYMMVGDNTGDLGNERNSLFLHQWYPLSGLKDSHCGRLFGGDMQLKVKLILKDVMPGDTIKEFVSHNEVCKILKKVRTNFVRMRKELKQASSRRDQKMRELRMRQTNKQIRKRNEDRKAKKLEKHEEDMYGRAMEHEIMPYFELGRRSEKRKLDDEIIELEKKVENASQLGKLLEEELKDKLLILKDYVDGTVLKKYLYDLQARFGESVLDLLKTIGDTSEFVAQKAQSAVYSDAEWDRTVNVKTEDNSGIVPWVSGLFAVGDSSVADSTGEAL